MADIIAVVVTYNRIQQLKKCIYHIISQSLSCDIMIVDNNSTDGTKDWCDYYTHHNNRADKRNVKIYYENTGANLGGAGGFNYGMKKAVELGYDYIWVMDDDAFPEENALKALIDTGIELNALTFDKKQEKQPFAFGFLSSIVLWTDGSLCKMNIQKKCDENRKKTGWVSESDFNEKYTSIESATFVSLLFPAAVIRLAGLPIKEFFIWTDDIEYTKRIRHKLKLPCYAVPESIVVHGMSDNIGTDIVRATYEKIQRYNFQYRNENYTYRQYGLKGFAFYTLHCGYDIIQIILHSKDHKSQRAGIILKNYFSGLRFNPGVEYPLHGESK